MKKIVFLMCFIPSITFGYQTTFHGHYESSEIDTDSGVTSYLTGLEYYLHELDNDGYLFKEVGFLNRVSSLIFVYGTTIFEINNPSLSYKFNGSTLGYGANLYQNDLNFSVLLLSDNLDGTGVVSGATVTSNYIKLQAGSFIGKNSLVLLGYGKNETSVSNLGSDSSSTEISQEISYKEVKNNYNLELGFQINNYDDAFEQYTTYDTNLLIDYYLTKNMYFNIGYKISTGDTNDDDVNRVSVGVGGLVSKDLFYSFELSERQPKVGVSELSLSFGAGINF